MATSTVLGNGDMLILMDDNGEVRDLYYPRAGMENHVVGLTHRLGVAIDSKFYWLKDLEKTNIQSSTSLKSLNIFVHTQENIRIEFENTIYNEKPFFIRKVTVFNDSNKVKNVKLFFGQEFRIKENKFRNTGFYYPHEKVVIHYRGRRVFLVNIISSEGGIDDYTVGLYDYKGNEGSYKNAEKIFLAQNSIEHGPVDSVVSKTLNINPNSSKQIYYVLLAGKTIDDVLEKNNLIQERKSPSHIMKSTNDYWNAWRNKRKINFTGLSDELVQLFYRSLFIIRTHVDNYSGGIIASGDSSMYRQGKDSYAYVWPRDASYIASTMCRIGYPSISENQIKYFADVISEGGYILHRFELDKSLGSSWHPWPWVAQGKIALPIQEDETAAMIHLMWEHFKVTKDVDLLEKYFEKLILGPADFMGSFYNPANKLPLKSYDLWEEQEGVFTYTVCSVISALSKASDLATILGKTELSKMYKDNSEEIKKGLLSKLYNNKNHTFYKSINTNEEGGILADQTADSSSLFALWNFNILEPDSKILRNHEKFIEEKLKTVNGEYIRYENDNYYKNGQTPNPWIITTLWKIQLELKRCKSYPELLETSKKLNNIIKMQTESGILPEQIDYKTNSPLSASPLIWSHAVFVESIIIYIEKLEEFNIGEKCLPK